MSENERIIGIVNYGGDEALRITDLLAEKLTKAGLIPVTNIETECLPSVIVVIGGDGSLLRTLRRLGFPDIPFVGINTGHLGFFQELNEEDLDDFVEKYLRGEYERQSLRTVSGVIETKDEGKSKGEKKTVYALNELMIKAADSRLAHLEVYIGEHLIEKFHGDGIVISTPAGSTAYNYALGGSIVDPRLELLQLTPLAPVNTTAYRSFTSGIVLPPGLPIRVIPAMEGEIFIAADSNEEKLPGILSIEAGLSEKSITLLRFKSYEFWTTVKQKLLTL